MATFITHESSSGEACIKMYFGDDVPARTVSGVRWWLAESNSSRTFYLGLDDKGALWRTACGDGDEKLCDCPWGARCTCETLSSDEVMNRNRRPVKNGEQLYLGR